MLNFEQSLHLCTYLAAESRVHRTTDPRRQIDHSFWMLRSQPRQILESNALQSLGSRGLLLAVAEKMEQRFSNCCMIITLQNICKNQEKYLAITTWANSVMLNA
jgi:hypothetical protein